MNARLDMLVPATNASAALPARSLICCPRYSPTEDTGPEVVGIVVDAAERLVVRIVAALPALLEKTGFARR